ncbi:CRTAC1 family protein [Candidatus Poribacteria bacterium]|nr:CRTAC1 family protein [Candidatus Poribacteria bacterium]
MGVGAAFFDFDNDGHLDLYLVNGAYLPASDEDNSPTDRLYRNNGDGTFADVTYQAGITETRYGMGCCVGDYDNDGNQDIYITNFGMNLLYRNNGDGTFTDVTERAGVGDNRFSAGCAFADYDKDGFLDLFVANYVLLDLANSPDCSQRGIPAYCRPEDFPPTPDVLYHNNGDGTFSDVTKPSGITSVGRGLGVLWSDVDSDGWLDLYVANDRMANFLYRNSGDGTFTEVGELYGVALNEHAFAESGMGVDAGDYDNDGDLDLVVTNYQAETNTLYQNDGNGIFWDMTAQAHLSEPTLIPLAWGTVFADFDNDGWLDLFFANGHLHDNIEMLEEVGTYKQQNQLFRNMGNGQFVAISRRAIISKSSRGVISGDYDNDGDIDLFVMNIGDTPDLLRNDTPQTNHWLGVKLVGTTSNRDGIGARVTLRVGKKKLLREVKSGSSYLSQNDLRLLFGLGKSNRVDSITVHWPSGIDDQLQSVDADEWLTIQEGYGIIADVHKP